MPYTAIRVEAQTQKAQKVNINLKSATITQFLTEIRQQTGINFVLNVNLERTLPKINANIDNKSVDEALNDVLTPLGCSYEISNRLITIYKKTQNQTSSRRLTGFVMDENNEPLPGATVQVVGTSMIVVADVSGHFNIDIPEQACSIKVSYAGMTTQTITIGKGSIPVKKNVILISDNSLNEVVVTGIFENKRELYTGSATTFNKEQLAVAGNRSLLSTLQNLDPSFHISEDISIGSDPNALPSITIRGASSLPTDVQDLQVSSNNLRTANQPLFILDGFEIPLSRFMDLDESMVESITILKDANGTALYGSKGSNGVVVITSKRMNPGKLLVSYKGTLAIEAPDLTSYNLMNAKEKLAFERAAGLYDNSNALQDVSLKDLYNSRKLDAERGVDTYWLKYPVRTGVGSRHSLSIDGGDENLRYGASLGFNDIEGAMKGSSRKTFTANMQLLYRYKNISFRDNLQVSSSHSKNSPYGSFHQYTLMNSYFAPYDDNGNLNKILEYFYYPSVGRTSTVGNPLYNAILPSKDKSKYMNITNNFSIEWYILPELFVNGQFSYAYQTDRSDVYVPASNTEFENYADEDLKRRGRYTLGNGEQRSYDLRLTLNYSKTFHELHQIFLGAGITMEENKMESFSTVGEGFSIENMDFMGMANQYQLGGRPMGTESITRGMGMLFNFRYTFNKKYFADLNGKYDGSSQFGSNNHFAPFWSTGVGWNMQYEPWIKKLKVVDVARLRTSYGITGSQNFSSYLSIRTYNSLAGVTMQGWNGVTLLSMGNPDLKWQRTNQLNIGLDLELFRQRFYGSIDIYKKVTNDLLSDINLPYSSGFSSYKSNVGKVQNNGYEISAAVVVIRSPQNKLQWTVGTKLMHNTNKVKEISNSLQALNEQLASQSSYNPIFLYKEGESLNTIYAVQSKGIDPATGKEVFIKQDGTETFTWDSADEVACGVAEPKIQGTVNSDIRWQGFTLNAIFGYRWGGKAYNTTLANKVENILPYENADKRVLYDRWKQPGDHVMYKSVTNTSPTYATSRFVFKDNAFYCSSITLGYDFPREWVKKNLHMEFLNLSGYLEDLFYTSTIKRERGTSYPYSRKFSLSLTARF